MPSATAPLAQGVPCACAPCPLWRTIRWLAEETTMSADRALIWRRVLAGVVLASAVAAAGCGGEGPRHPVDGRVLLKGQPLKGKEGQVMLKPDAAKGNKASVASAGALQRDGSFSILTTGKPGAPAGWYK